MGSHCVKLSSSHSRGRESSMKKLVACMSQDNFSLSSEDEKEEEEEEEEEEGEEEIPVQGKLLLMEAGRQEERAQEGPVIQQSQEPKPVHS
ncbi:protamine-3 [Orycteropus afer afer]|uniref:Protamine-3 n=1 Tax=Orycteropus afer afer TaxID=1230840 RepID=A0A8B6ZQG5_ORYAF|nr:protamine-3 [Orycteropus afer afer]